MLPALILFISIITTIVPAQPRAVDGLCVVLLIDDSGSMKSSDPALLRYQGARLFISLLDETDRVGVVHFSGTARRGTDGLRQISDLDLQQALQPQAPDGFTDFLAVLQEADDLLEDEDCQPGLRRIILLTDGKPELPGGIPANYESQTLLQAQALNSPVISIALTPQAESPLLHQLAGQFTGGQVIPARTASDLLDAYLQVLSAFKAISIHGTGALELPGPVSFVLDPALTPYLQRAVFVAAGPSGLQASLTAPGGATCAGECLALSSQGAGFSTFVVDSPTPGNWQVSLWGKGKAAVRLILYSQLRLSVLLPSPYQALGKPLHVEAQISGEDGRGSRAGLIGDAALSAWLEAPDGSQLALDRLYDDGTHGDRLAGDGIYGGDFPPPEQMGYYRLSLRGSKGLVPLAASTGLWVEPFPELELDFARDQQPVYSTLPLAFQVRLEGGDSGAYSGAAAIQCSISGPAFATEVLKPALVGDAWRLAYIPQADGRHLLECRAGFTYRGQALERQTSREFSFQRIPVLQAQATALDSGRVEKASLASGIPFSIFLTLQAFQPQQVALRLESMPAGLRLEPSTIWLQPGENNLFGVLRGEVGEGDYRGRLILSGQDGSLQPVSLPVHLQVVEPRLQVEPLQTVFEFPFGQAPAVDFPLVVTLNSDRVEWVELAFQGDFPFRIVPRRTLLFPGRSEEIHFQLIPRDSPPPGQYAGVLILSGRRGLKLAPPTLEMDLEVAPEPFWERWGVPLGGLGLASVCSALAWPGLRRSRQRPAGYFKLLRGPLHAGCPAVGSNFNLTARAGGWFDPRVVLGSAANCHIRLPGPGILPVHAVLKGGVSTVPGWKGHGLRALPQRVLLVENPHGGALRVGRQPVGRAASVLLNPGEHLVMGEYEFEYRR